MDRGQIKEIGRHDELMEKSGYYRRLYDLQFQHGGLEQEPLFKTVQLAVG